MRGLWAAMLCVATAAAAAPERSPIPVARPDAAWVEPAPSEAPPAAPPGTLQWAATVALPRPARRAPVTVFATPSAPLEAPRPEPRGETPVETVALRPRVTEPVTEPMTEPMTATGSVCGVPGLKGRTLPEIGPEQPGCGIEAPVAITSVEGLALSVPATLDCTTAQALATWVTRGLKPAVGRTGGGVAGLDVAASYACRPRNNVEGARISEHGRGRAIDIAGIRLQNGTDLTVAADWSASTGGRILRRAYDAACGTFGTTLGPGSDGHHQDHMHFDTARYRSGPYCR